jgi:asparagine synthase (glutamine-hydrolysing)
MPWELSRLLDHDFAETGLGQLDPLPWQTGAGSGPVLTDLGRVMLLESTWYLRNQLLRDADWASMDHSVELRTPLVDWRLFMTIAPGLAARTVPGKDALIRAPGFPLPASQTGREKTGFGMPLGSWLFEENKGSKDRVRSPGEASRRLAAGLLGAVVRVSASQT